MIPVRATSGVAALALAAAVAAVAPAVRDRLAADPARVAVQAQADYEAGRYERAAEGLGRLARLRSPTPMDRMARALVARARGRPQAALAELDEIPDDHRLGPMAELLAGRIQLQLGRLRAAEARFQAALEDDPKLDEARAELAYLYNLQRRFREMDGQFEALAERGTLGYDRLVHWGKTRNGIWSPAEDCAVLERVVAADRGDRPSRLALADGYRQMGRLDEADAVLDPLPVSDAGVLARRAMIANDRGEPERARRLLESGPADDPGLARLRGQLALKHGDPRAAARFFRIARAADPDDRAASYGLGIALQLSGAGEEARPYLDAARRHDELTPLYSYAATAAGRNDPGLPARIGAACEAAGRSGEARAWYRLAIARDPLDPAAQRGLRRLARVDPR